MKTSLTTLVVAFVVFGLSGTSFSEEIPGGIVYGDGDQVLCYDFASEQSRSLTADLKIKIKGPAAISGNGRILVWVQKTPKGDIFQSWVGPGDKPSATPTRKDYIKSGPQKNNLCDLPEFLPATPATVLVSDAKKSLIYDLRAKPVLYMDPQQANLAIRASRPDVFGPPKIQKETNLLVWSTVKISAVNTNFCSIFGSQSLWSYKSPCLPALTRDGKRLAFIDQADGVFGPIYANGGVNPRDDGNIKMEKVKISLKSCNGLAWRTDGTLTYLSEGKVCSVAGIVFAQGINGTNPYWVSDNTLLFRDASGYLCKWENGKVTRTSVRTPTGFSYCWKTPFSNPDEDIVDPEKEKVSSGIIEFDERTQANKFSIANVNLSFTACDGNSIWVNLGKRSGQKPLALAKTTLSEVNEVKDPTTYDGPEGFSNANQIKIMKNQVAIVRAGNRYVVIKMVSAKPDFKTIAEMPTSMQDEYRKRGIKGNMVPPLYHRTTFAWKYIPANSSDKTIAQGD